jgi:hypothetical protein
VDWRITQKAQRKKDVFYVYTVCAAQKEDEARGDLSVVSQKEEDSNNKHDTCLSADFIDGCELRVL